MNPDGASMVLGPFAKTKGSRLPGRNPAPNVRQKKQKLFEITITYQPNNENQFIGPQFFVNC